MSKKKSTAVKKPVEPETIEKAYVAGKWHGKVNYQCSTCPWSTLDLDEMEKHVAKHSKPKQAKVRRVDTGLIGPSGGKIVREEEEPVEPVEEDTNG